MIASSAHKDAPFQQRQQRNMEPERQESQSAKEIGWNEPASQLRRAARSLHHRGLVFSVRPVDQAFVVERLPGGLQRPGEAVDEDSSRRHGLVVLGRECEVVRTVASTSCTTTRSTAWLCRSPWCSPASSRWTCHIRSLRRRIRSWRAWRRTTRRTSTRRTWRWRI